MWAKLLIRSVIAGGPNFLGSEGRFPGSFKHSIEFCLFGELRFGRVLGYNTLESKSRKEEWSC